MKTSSTSSFNDTNNCNSNNMSGRRNIELLADFVRAFQVTVAQQVIHPDNVYKGKRNGTSMDDRSNKKTM